MIVRHSLDLPQKPLPNPSLCGWELVAPEDGVHYSCYEVFIACNSTVLLQAPPGSHSNHIYYCISGEGICTATDGGKHLIQSSPAVIAFSSGLSSNLTVTSSDGMRLFVIYCEDADPTNNRELVRSIQEINATDRDIDFGSGHSRRFLLRSDGFTVGLHYTTVIPGTSMRLEYKHHLETAYYYSGATTYIWNDGKESAQTKADQRNGTVICMDQNDKHQVKTSSSASKDSECACVFYPALVGPENHDLSKDGYSSFELL